MSLASEIRDLVVELDNASLHVKSFDFSGPVVITFAPGACPGRYEQMARAVLSYKPPCRVFFARNILQDGSCVNIIIAFSDSSDDGWKHELMRLIRQNIPKVADLVIAHARYILEHDQPCRAALSPFAYNVLLKALSDGPVACRNVLSSLAKHSYMAIDEDTKSRIISFLNGNSSIPEPCMYCRNLKEYNQLRQEIGFEKS